MLANQMVETTPFGAEHERGRLSELYAIVSMITALIETVDPEAALLQAFERAAQITGARHREILQRASRGLTDGFGDAGRPPVRYDERIGAGGVGRARDGSQIVRILHAIEDYEHARPGGYRIEVGITLSSAERYHPLMAGRFAGAVELLARLKTDGNSSFAAQVDNFLEPRTRRSTRDQDPLQRPVGAQRLPHRMDSRQHSHYNRVVGSVMVG